MTIQNRLLIQLGYIFVCPELIAYNVKKLLSPRFLQVLLSRKHNRLKFIGH